MKKLIIKLMILAFVGLFMSCLTITNRQQQVEEELERQYPQEKKDALRRAFQLGEQMIGTVEATFEGRTISINELMGSPESAVAAIVAADTEILETAYVALLQEAKKQFHNNVDIRDITNVRSNVIPRSKPERAMYVFSGKVISIESTNNEQNQNNNENIFW